MVNPPKPRLLDQVLGRKSVFDSCGRKLRSSGKRVAHGVSRGFGYLKNWSREAVKENPPGPNSVVPDGAFGEG